MLWQTAICGPIKVLIVGPSHVACQGSMQMCLFQEAASALSKPGCILVPSAGLRHVATALLDGPQAAAESLHSGMHSAANGDALPGAPVCASVAYLRDRVGVPRDMPLPAARQFRAHLNWLVDELRN